MKLPLNKDFNDFVRSMYLWDKERILDYAAKRGLTFHQAIYEIVRTPKVNRDSILDAVVDKQYHSSKRPKLETA